MHVETLTYRDHDIEIHIDEQPCDPMTEWDMFGTCVCWHRRYNLGHDHMFRTVDDFEDFIESEQLRTGHPPILLPLYLYDHSGLTISTAPFSCPWDSGQVGWVYATRETILKEYGGTRISKRKRQRATELITAEIKTYDAYLRGDVYGFIARSNSTSDDDDDEIGSCWGFFGADHHISGLMHHAEADIDAFIQKQNPLLAHADLI